MVASLAGPLRSRTNPAAQLRVCHLIHSLQYGGAERQFVDVLNVLPAAAKYAVLLRDYGLPGFHEQLQDQVTLLSVQVRLRNSALEIGRLARWLRRQRVDVVHTHMFWANLYGALAARLAGVPVVVTTDHGSSAWKRAHHHWLDGRVIGALADLRFCVAENVLQVLRDLSGVSAEKLTLISNGTALAAPVTVRPGHALHIGAVGRLVWQKDHRTLILAAEQLHLRGIDFRLTIIGDGPLRKELEQLVAERGLDDRVSMPGFQQDVDACLRSFDVFAMSSIDEGQPVSLLEAMARGLPVVATRVGGIPATVADGREGLLVEPGDVSCLADALAALATAPDRRAALGQQAWRRVERDFSCEAIARRYADTYAELYRERTAVGRVGG